MFDSARLRGLQMSFKKITVRLLSAAVLGLPAASLATPAFATNWVLGAVQSDLTMMYYDTETIQYAVNEVTVWEKWDYALQKSSKYRDQKLRKKYNCAERTATILYIASVYRDGKSETINLQTYEQIANAVVPETVGETMLESCCAAKVPQ